MSFEIMSKTPCGGSPDIINFDLKFYKLLQNFDDQGSIRNFLSFRFTVVFLILAKSVDFWKFWGDFFFQLVELSLIHELGFAWWRKIVFRCFARRFKLLLQLLSNNARCKLFRSCLAKIWIVLKSRGFGFRILIFLTKTKKEFRNLFFVYILDSYVSIENNKQDETKFSRCDHTLEVTPVLFPNTEVKL